VRVIIWIANHALWISLLGAIATLAVRLERLLPRWMHKILLLISVFVTCATPLLGMLKKSLDDQWKAEMQQRVAAALKASQPKPFKERLTIFCNRIDAAILPALRNGNTKFHGNLYQDQLAELRELAADPEARGYLRVEYGGVSSVLDRGIATDVTFELDPSLLQQ
jgi:hypothetical protein